MKSHDVWREDRGNKHHSGRSGKNAEDAWFAAEAVSRGGIPIVELTMTVPKATELIADLVEKHPDMVVGAGTVSWMSKPRAPVWMPERIF